ncbi:MAG: DUF2877 domain-containing protein [Burkholderiaceae bacterium]
MSAASSSQRAAAAPARARRVLAVRSIDVRLLSALQAGRFTAQVHSVFDRVVNLEPTDGGLFTLAARELDNAPNTAIVDIASFSATGIAVGDPVAVVDDELHIGDATVVQPATASPWQASLPGYAGASDRLLTQLRCARSHLARNELRSGLAGQGADPGTFASEIVAALRQRSSSLLEALAQARAADACRHAISLIGLGPGLTPSGDDFLVGLLAVLNVADSPCHGWLDRAAPVLLHAAGQATNAISLAALAAAADGRVRASIAALIDALLHGTPDSLVPPLRVVLEIGATSGADIVAGILAGLELNVHVEARCAHEPQPHSLIPKRPSRNSQAACLAATHSTGA